ncbi:hypothetical protein [Methanolobus profundi]|nr:hypothetical protein [Methanolobus profundi]
MNLLYDLRDWFYECDRLLFLAEVHYHRENVLPSGHKFSHELTSSCLERMFKDIKKMANESNCCVNFDTCACHDEVSFLKEVLDNISTGEWGNMDVQSILKAQSIVQELANAVNADILENSELRGYPRIYNACRIR